MLDTNKEFSTRKKNINKYLMTAVTFCLLFNSNLAKKQESSSRAKKNSASLKKDDDFFYTFIEQSIDNPIEVEELPKTINPLFNYYKRDKNKIIFLAGPILRITQEHHCKKNSLPYIDLSGSLFFIDLFVENNKISPSLVIQYPPQSICRKQVAFWKEQRIAGGQLIQEQKAAKKRQQKEIRSQTNAIQNKTVYKK